MNGRRLVVDIAVDREKAPVWRQPFILKHEAVHSVSDKLKPSTTRESRRPDALCLMDWYQKNGPSLFLLGIMSRYIYMYGGPKAG